ncbi:MAG: hypothetical protein V3V08_23125 [Nannocystaceae bacterium]
MPNLIYLLVAAGAAYLWSMRESADDEDGPEPAPALPGLSPSGDPPPALDMTLIGESVYQPDPPDLPPGLQSVPATGGGGGGSAPAWHQWGYTGIPNLSGDEDGYNTDLYPSAKEVRQGFMFLGYQVGGGDETLNGHPLVKKFQEDWNEAAETGFQDAIGEFLPDKVPGPGTLRALEIAATGTDGVGLDDLARGYKWQDRFN